MTAACKLGLALASTPVRRALESGASADYVAGVAAENLFRVSATTVRNHRRGECLCSRPAPAPRIQDAAKDVLTLDIERLPGRARIQHRGLTIEGDFWDLGAWKHTIGYRIPHTAVLEWPRTVCVAWKWYNTEVVEFASEWGDGRDQMLRRVWDAYDRAQVLYGHNVAAFDTKHLNTEWRDLGLPEPAPFKTVDTLKEARKKFGDESKTLSALTTRLGIATKTGAYNVETARQACAGDPEAQEELQTYNEGDAIASEAFVDRLRGWISHPHNLFGEGGLTCPNCWGDNLEPNGITLASQFTYALFRCGDCGKNVKGAKHSTAATSRGVA